MPLDRCLNLSGIHPGGGGGGRRPFKSTQLPPKRKERRKKKERERENGGGGGGGHMCTRSVFASSLKTVQYLCHLKYILSGIEGGA